MVTPEKFWNGNAASLAAADIKYPILSRNQEQKTNMFENYKQGVEENETTY